MVVLMVMGTMRRRVMEKNAIHLLVLKRNLGLLKEKVIEVLKAGGFVYMYFNVKIYFNISHAFICHSSAHQHRNSY